jgi:hypothetical protein
MFASHGDNDKQLDRIGVCNPEVLSGKYLPRTVLFDLKPA